MREHDPSSLRDVDGIEVVDVSDADPDRVTEYVAVAERRPAVRLGRIETEEVVQLWRRLPPAESVRCHVPPYVVRFFRGTAPIAKFSMCWKCDNAFGFEGSAVSRFYFDGKSEAARTLLEALRRACPSSVHRE